MKIQRERIRASCPRLSDVECFDCIPSTNLYARERLSKEELGISLFLADAQSAGRGRLGRSFHSPSGAGVYMSLVLPLDQIRSPETLTVVAGVALCEVLEEMFPTLSPSIKWVNDIYAADKKLAGILVEGVYSASGTPYAIIGIGINCQKSAFPEELADIATDIATCTGEAVDPAELICALTNRLLDALESDFSAVLTAYRAHSYLLGKEVTVHPHASESYVATAHSIDASGRLIVRLSDGTEQVLSSADVSVRKA